MTALQISDTEERADALLEQARDLIPTLAARGDETESLRRLPVSTVADLKAMGLTRLCQPRQYGGAELPINRAGEIIATVARGCGSTAWVCAVFTDHSLIVSMFPTRVADDVWRRDPEAVISAGYHPTGSAERVDGGWRLSGKWGWVSGCDHADWLLVGALAPFGDIGPVNNLFLVPRQDVEIEDNWHVMGLQGTGSKNILIGESIVPDHRIFPLPLLNGGESVRGFGETRPLYRLPHVTTIPFFFNAVGLGIAESMLDVVIEQIRQRETMGVRLATVKTLQTAIADVAAELDCARLLIMRDTSSAMGAMRDGRALTIQEKARNRRDQAYADRLCKSAAGKLHGLAGAGAIFHGHAIERKFRDVHAVVNHVIQSWEIAGTTYGEMAFGLEPETQFI